MKELIDRDAIKARSAEILKAAGAQLPRNPRHNFRCLVHDDKKASMHFDPQTQHIKCYGCNFCGDVFDLMGKLYGAATFETQAAKACELIGIEIPRVQKDFRVKKSAAAVPAPRVQKKEEPQADYSADYKKWQAALDATKADCAGADYLLDRRIGLQIARAFGLGYAAAWQYPNRERAKASQRIIIPTSASQYEAREIGGSGDYSKLRVGGYNLFNGAAISDTNNEYIRVTEGAFDALAIMQTTGERNVVALCGSGGVQLLIDALKKRAQLAPLSVWLHLDDDDGGKRFTAQLLEELKEVDGIRAFDIQLCDSSRGIKDPNDAVQSDEYFPIFKAKLEEGAAGVVDEYAQQHSVAQRLKGFTERRRRDAAAVVSTGFESVDRILAGGLHSGLYFVGALSSVGKTAFVQNLAENIARQGRDVIFFSFEMSEDEIYSRGLARLMFETEGAAAAATIREILTPQQVQGDFGSAQRLERAVDEYARGVASHFYMFDTLATAADVAAAVQQHISARNVAPVVIVDYLQIMQLPKGEAFTDKGAVDFNVAQLKEVARKFGVPVLAISSFNRNNYNTEVNMTSFKESGAVEYSSDFLIGLQYHSVTEYLRNGGRDATESERKAEIAAKITAAKEADGKQPLAVDVKLLKDRNGGIGAATLNYYKAFNAFVDVPEKGVK